MAGQVPVLVVRETDGVFHVLTDRCSRSSRSLSQGEIADGCVTCRWHGSVFRLSDGWNVGGAATAPDRASPPGPTATATPRRDCPTPAEHPACGE
ncbi:Rieske 2Fe-2S domain-containing protein [Kitasatospora nipponensis]